MSKETFANKADRLLTEVEEESLAVGRDPDSVENFSIVYERVFGENIPSFEPALPDETKITLILECLARQIKLSKLSEVAFLELQYECRFGKVIPFGFTTPFRTEEELTTTLRTCLAEGKPYETPQEVITLMDQGVDF